MQLEQIYTGCLSQGAYFIESEGEAVVIDPLREVEPYLQRAADSNAKIKYIFETHFHADFVSGHLDLARETGATIVYGPNATTAYPAHIAQDGEIFKVGKLTFQLLHTPGHTFESSCYLLKDERGKNVALFTGDTLFIGDVGRPDLAQYSAAFFSPDYLASLLYESLHQKIMPLEDDIVVFPAHGAGSACGKNMSKETSDTLGHQKQTNYALRPGITKDQFVHELTTKLPPQPAYFPMNVEMNQKGYDPIRDILARGSKALTLRQFEQALASWECILLDTRNAQKFARGFIPGAINIGLDGSFAPWAGTLLAYQKQGILLVTEQGKELESVTRLARIGYDQVIGYLDGGFRTWEEAGKPIENIQSITASNLADAYRKAAINIIDVRKESEYEQKHLRNALHIPLDTINHRQTIINKTQPYYVHCAGGYRSMVFISILRRWGYHNLIDVDGGFSMMQACGAFDLVTGVESI